jgi:hypothetical protein
MNPFRHSDQRPTQQQNQRPTQQQHQRLVQKQKQQEFVAADFPELYCPNNQNDTQADNQAKKNQITRLDYMKATTQPKIEELKENPLLPGWAYLSYDNNRKFQIIYGSETNYANDNDTENNDNNNEKMNQINQRWRQNVDNFIEINGIDTYIRVYGNYQDPYENINNGDSNDNEEYLDNNDYEYDDE